MNVLICFVINQNTFKVTILTYPAINFFFYALQLQVQYFNAFNPYSGEQMSLHEKIAISVQRLVVFFGVEVLIVYNNYI